MGSYMVVLLGLFDIKGDYTYVGLSDFMIKRIAEKAESIFPSLKSFSLKAGIDARLLYRMKRTKRVSLIDFRKITEILEIKPDEFNSQVTLITSNKGSHIGINAPKLPFDFSKESAMYVIAGILGDGSISKTGIVGYYNQRKNLIEIFQNSMSDLFGDIDSRLKLREDRTYAISYPKIAARIFSSVGMKWGPKAESNQGIPDFIFGLGRNAKVTFVRQFFNDEGNVRLKDRRIQIKQTIETTLSKNQLKSDIYKYAPNVLNDIRSLLYSLNIISKISLGAYRIFKGKIKTDWELSIYGKENLEKFRDLIGFDLKYKSTLLDKCLKSYIYPSAGRNQRILYALQYSALSEIENGFIDKFTLSKLTGRAVWRTTTYFLVDLLKKGLVEVTEKPLRSGGGHLNWKYKITKAGWNYIRDNAEFVFIQEVKEKIKNEIHKK